MADTLLALSKRCGKCRELKPDTEYHSRGKNYPGKTSAFCKPCARKVTGDHRQAARDAEIAARAWDRWKFVTQEIYLRAFENRQGKIPSYGITLADYLDLIDAHENRCAICGKLGDDKNLAIDHCHDTGEIRGLLCSPCNLGLGQLGDTREALQRALDYLDGKRAKA